MYVRTRRCLATEAMTLAAESRDPANGAEIRSRQQSEAFSSEQ